MPVRPLSEYKRLNALFGRLPEMKARIEALERALQELTGTRKDLTAETRRTQSGKK